MAKRQRNNRTHKSKQGASVGDVAKLAGVSTATVSRVLNSSGPVGDAARKKVVSAVETLGYTPNAAARALKLRRFNTIGAVVPTLENASFAIAVEALQSRLREADYTLLLGSSGYDISNEAVQVRTLLSRGVEGMVVVGGIHDPEIEELCKIQGVPLIQTWTLRDDAPCVGVDNFEIGRTVTEYLLDLGHRYIGVIAGETRNNDRAAERVAGVASALSARGGTLARERIIERPYKITEGQIGLRALLSSEPRLTAVICGNDLLAFGALIEANAQGIAVPEKLSITGIDDMEFAAELTPPLTTVAVPADEIGRRSADYLIDHLSGKTAPALTKIPVNLIVRGSTGPVTSK